MLCHASMDTHALVTVVGGSGFVGRHTVKALAQAGWRVRVLCRDAVGAEFLKTAGNVGQISIEYADITQPETLKGKFVGSTAVVSLVSILYQQGRQKFDAINVHGARAVAQAAKQAGAKRFVHVSALGVDRATDTRYGSTKLAGEKAVREVFPAATILRPSLIIGPEDGFFQRFARMAQLSPVLPLIGGGKTAFQPVLVTDVATAICNALTRDDVAGKTYELGGKQVYRFRQLLELMNHVTRAHTRLISLPTPVAALKGALFDILPLPFAPPLTRDQVKLLKYDNVLNPKALGLEELGITPASVEAALPELLARFIRR